jgi:hypothetical protein
MRRTPCEGSNGGAADSQIQRDVKDKITSEHAFQEEASEGVRVARKLMDLLEAKQPQWNPQEKCLEQVADHKTQLAALREIAKILGMYPTKDSDSVAPPVVIHLGQLTPREFRLQEATNTSSEPQAG